jgi:DNA-binding MarR family transcriptional regulator
LTISQLQYIQAIGMLGEPTITDIAHQLGITKASVTAGVNKLVQMGYVTKAQSAEDRRVFHVSLTEASQQLVQTKKQALQAYGAFIEAALTAEEAVQLEGILTKLVQHFQAN